MNNFNVKLNIGKQGEAAVAEYMASRNHKVEDVSNNPDYQGKDIDFILTHSTTGDTCLLEVKSDKRIHDTGNLCIEIGNDRITGWREGWMYYCEADYICFYDYTTGDGYLIDWVAAKPLLKQHANFKRFFSDDGCYSDVYLLPIWKAKQLGLVAHQFNYLHKEVA